MKNFLITVCLIFFSFFYNSVIAKNNFVFVDLDMVITDSIPGTYVLEQLNDLREKNVIDFETKAKLLKENEEKIIKQKNILSSEDFQLKVNDLKIEIKKYNKYRENKIKKFNQIRKNNTNKLLGLINPILTQYSKDESISMILQKKDIIIGKAELDITKPIIDLVDKNIKKFKIK